MTCMYFQHANKLEYQELPSHNGRTEFTTITSANLAILSLTLQGSQSQMG